MGANQSGNQTEIGQQPGTDQRGILVVNPTPASKCSTDDQIILSPRVPPILTLDGLKIDPERHKNQLDYRIWQDFIKIFSEFSESRTKLVTARQNQLRDKITFVDNHVQNFTDSYVHCKHKALARMNDDCRRVEELNKLLHKCTIQSELCLDMLSKLNFLLPPEHKLESLDSDKKQDSCGG